jgi:hypothetical protein
MMIRLLESVETMVLLLSVVLLFEAFVDTGIILVVASGDGRTSKEALFSAGSFLPGTCENGVKGDAVAAAIIAIGKTTTATTTAAEIINPKQINKMPISFFPFIARRIITSEPYFSSCNDYTLSN